jgi:hypothetical protein
MDHGSLQSRFHRIEDVVEESSELASVERRGESLKVITSLAQLAQQLGGGKIGECAGFLWRS